MNNNTKVRIHLSKPLLETLTREILKEAKVNDGYTVAVKQPKAPKAHKAEPKVEEESKTKDLKELSKELKSLSKEQLEELKALFQKEKGEEE